MTTEEMLQSRLRAVLETIRSDTTSDFLVEEYERIHREITRLQDQREFK